MPAYINASGVLTKVRTGTPAGNAPFTYGADKAATIARAGLSNPAALVTHTGNLVCNTAGATYENLDITGWVELRANNVTLRNCRIQIGAVLMTSATPDVQAGAFAWYNTSGHVLDHVEVAPSNPTVDTYGIIGSGYTLRDSHIHDCVDALQINNAYAPITVEGGVLEKCRWYATDPRQVDGSHNDVVQIILGGGHTFTGVVIDQGGTIAGRTADGYYSAAFGIIATQNSGTDVIDGFTVDSCWFDGGGYSAIKVEEKNNGVISPLVITDNRFEGDTQNWLIHGSDTSINPATITGNTGPDGNALSAAEINADSGVA